MEIGNQMHTLVQGLKKLGINAKSLNYYPTYLSYPSDMVLALNLCRDVRQANEEIKKIVPGIIETNDVFHFHFGTSLMPDHSDLPVLKRLGKTILMHHWGSDVRLRSVAAKWNPYVKVKNGDENFIRRSLERLSEYIDTCVVSDYELYEYVREYYRKVAVIPQAINLDEYRPAADRPKNGKLTVVHAPTSPEIKGTDYIRKAVEELKSRYDFNFRLVQGVSHEEAKKIYLDADLVVDQLLTGTYGLLSVECMAMGKPVICYISDFMKEKYPAELPLISANPDSFRETMEFLLKNREYLAEVGKNSRKYAEMYHDVDLISPRLLALYQALSDREERE